MASLSTCHLGLWLGWQILLNEVERVFDLKQVNDEVEHVFDLKHSNDEVQYFDFKHSNNEVEHVFDLKQNVIDLKHSKQ